MCTGQRLHLAWPHGFSTQHEAGGYLTIDDGLGDITSKATGLELVCQRLGLTSQDVLAIGNDTNDIGMFEWAGHSACFATLTVASPLPPLRLAAADARSTVRPQARFPPKLTPCMYARWDMRTYYHGMRTWTRWDMRTCAPAHAWTHAQAS